MLERISENLSEAMQNKVAFRIPIFGGIPVPVSCVVTWIIMAILVIASILLTRNLKLIPDRKQMMLESFVGFLRDFFREQLGEKGMAYFPFLATVIIYIGFANIIGLLGFAFASGLGGVAPNAALLFAARALQGGFAALLAPAALSLITVTFVDPKERAKAFGVFGAIGFASVANPFCHLRAHFLVSLLRTGIGLVLGLVLGAIVLLILRACWPVPSDATQTKE